MSNFGQPPPTPDLSPIDRAMIVGRVRRTAGTVFIGRALLNQTEVATYPYVVGQAIPAAVRVRRTVPKPRLAPPVIAPQGGYPVAPGTFVGLGPAERIRRRRSLYSAIVAPPVLSQPFIAPPATIVSNLFLRRRGRGVPPSTILPTVTFFPPVARSANFISLGAAERQRRRRGPPSSTIVPPPISGRPVVPVGTFATQATQRALTRRTVPKPHLAAPVPFFLAPRATVVGQAVQRPLSRRGGAVAQTRWVATGSVRPGTFVNQAVPRALTRRTGPKPHLAGPVVTQVSTFVAPSALLVTNQSLQRALTRRTVPKPRLATPPGRGPVAPGLVLDQAIQRALTRRGPFPPKHLAPPLVAPAVGFRSAGFLTLQAVARGNERRYRDVAPAPHLAPRVTSPAGPGATIKLQAVPRALLGRAGHVHLPPAPGPGPVPAGTFVYQATKRPYVGRQAAKTLRPPSLVAPAVPFRAAGFLTLQAVQRGQERRFRDVVPAPHLAPRVPFPRGPGALVRLQAVAGRALLGRGGRVRLPSLGSPPPARVGTFVSQAIQRPYVGRRVPEPHLAAGIVTPFFVPPNAPGTFVTQAVERSLRARPAPKPHLATLGSPQPVRPATVVLQAVARSFARRYRDVAPEPHLAPPLVPQVTVPVPFGTFVRAAGARQLFRREGRVRLPRLGSAPPVRPGEFAYQAVARAYLGRGPFPRKHLASAIVTPPQAPVKTVPTILSIQALRRPYVERMVPLRPVVPPVVAPLVPSQPSVPFPPRGGREGRGTVRPGARYGLTGPRQTFGTVSPLFMGPTFMSLTLLMNGGGTYGTGIGRIGPPRTDVPASRVAPLSRVAKTAPSQAFGTVPALTMGPLLMNPALLMNGGKTTQAESGEVAPD